MNYYIADTHFSHNNIIGYDNRPFGDVLEMDDAMITLWNETVGRKDDVYILGDFCWVRDRMAFIYEKLNGRLHLIRGNHDPKNFNSAELAALFEISDYDEICDNGRHVVLSHYPIVSYKNLHKPDWYHLFGHVHNSWESNIVEKAFDDMFGYWETERRAFNVGCMKPWMNYMPRTLDQIITAYAANRKMQEEFLNGFSRH